MMIPRERKKESEMDRERDAAQGRGLATTTARTGRRSSSPPPLAPSKSSSLCSVVSVGEFARAQTDLRVHKGSSFN